MNLKQIGVIHSPFKTRSEAPFQGRNSEEVCEVEVFEEFLPGLSDLEGCTHLILLYWLDRADRSMLKAFPPYDGKEHGVFATRSPNRPNPVGVGIVERKEPDLLPADLSELHRLRRAGFPGRCGVQPRRSASAVAGRGRNGFHLLKLKGSILGDVGGRKLPQEKECWIRNGGDRLAHNLRRSQIAAAHTAAELRGMLRDGE